MFNSKHTISKSLKYFSKCTNKENLIKFHNEFYSYLKDNDVPDENICLTLNVLIQGNILLDKLKTMTYKDIVYYIGLMCSHNIPVEDMLFLTYRFSKLCYDKRR